MQWLMQPVEEALILLITITLYMLLQILLQLFLPKQSLLPTILFFVLLATLLRPVIDAFLLMQQLTAIFSAFFLAFIPLITTMLTLLQSIFSFLTWTPLVLFVLHFLVYVCEVWLLPALITTLLLDLCSRLYPQLSFVRLADLIRKTIFSLIAAAILILSSIFTISGFSWFTLQESVVSPVKKVIEQNVPIIGSLLVEGLSLLKSFQAAATTVTGVASITLMLTLAFTPAALLLIKAFTFKLAGAITEPFLERSMSQLLDDIGQTLFLLCGIALLLSVGFIVIWLLLFIMVQIGTGKL